MSYKNRSRYEGVVFLNEDHVEDQNPKHLEYFEKDPNMVEVMTIIDTHDGRLRWRCFIHKDEAKLYKVFINE